MIEGSKMHKFFYLNIFLLLWALFALTNSGFDTSEGRYHYQIAEQIIKHRQLSFDTWEAIGLKDMPLNCCFTVSPSGKIYGTHEIGNTVFYLPTAFVNVLLEKLLSGFVSADKIFELKQFVFSFQAGFYSALTATAFLGILRVGFAQRLIPSLLATSGLIFTTFFWTYTRSSFDGVLCSTLLTLSLLFLLIYEKKRRWIYLIISFICLGFSLITRLTMFFPILASVIYLTSLSRTSLIEAIRRVTVASLTLVPFLVWQLWYNQLRTGKFYASPVQSDRYLEYNGLDGNLLVGLQGLLISPGKSIFIYAPLLILSVLLLRRFYKLHRREAMYVILVTVFWLLLHAKLRSWYGAWGWGPRHFITVLPIIFLPFAVNIEYIMRKAVLRSWALILAGFGFVLALASIISNWHFRMTYAKERGLLSDDIFVWGFWNSQSLDMLKGAVTNIVHILTGMPIIETQTNSLANEYASSTINVWYNTFIFLGVPWYVVVLLVIPLLVLVALEIRNIKNILSYTSDKFKQL
jgi:hypothetical protein